jgi:serine/threonine protein kinase
MKTLESYNWTEIQGLLIAGKYPLVEFLGREEEWSLFRTIAANETFNVRVRFLDGPESLTAWRMLQAAPHPQLINIVDAGHFPLNGATLEYAVLEHWEDTLASVMGERELSGNEAREMLESIVPAIDHLHSLHLVHGKIGPARIVATGDKIKLSNFQVSNRQALAVSYPPTISPHSASLCSTASTARMAMPLRSPNPSPVLPNAAFARNRQSGLPRRRFSSSYTAITWNRRPLPSLDQHPNTNPTLWPSPVSPCSALPGAWRPSL